MNRHRDALKRARQAEKRRDRNTSVISRIKTLRKKILHKKTAARIVSRSAKKAAKK